MFQSQRYVSYMHAGKTYIYDRLMCMCFPLACMKFSAEDLKHW